MSDDSITLIEARPASLADQIRSVWRFRYFYPLLFSEISMRRYKQTVLGFWWLVARPLIPAVITVILFTHVVPIQTQAEPYPLFFLSSFTAWTLFQSTLSILPRGLLWSATILRRTYVPKLLVPFASLGPPLVEAAVILGLFLLTMAWFGFRTGTWWLNTSPTLLWFPLCAALAVAMGLAIGMVLSVVAAFMRDVVYMTPYFVQLFMLVTPVLYPLKFVPEHLRWIVYVFNPMASVVETARWSLTGHGEAPLAYLAVSGPIIFCLLALATWFFVRAEPYISDQV